MLPDAHIPEGKEFLAVLADDYADIGSQMKVARIIQARLNKKSDIRQVALKHIDLAAVARVIDLGCGTGYFTEGIAGRVPPGTAVTGIEMHATYKDHFLAACSRAGLKGEFEDRGIGIIREMEPGSYDLAICSYSLYFFPQYIPAIARILSPAGRFITITHGEPHMAELMLLVRETLKENGIPGYDNLPYDSLISKFSGTSGTALLAPAFSKVKRYLCRGTMEFSMRDTADLQRYMKLKAPFFLPAGLQKDHGLIAKITERVCHYLGEKGILRVSKDDYIFVCSGPKTIESS